VVVFTAATVRSFFVKKKNMYALYKRLKVKDNKDDKDKDDNDNNK
jgi:hypothetical protein